MHTHTQRSNYCDHVGGLGVQREGSEDTVMHPWSKDDVQELSRAERQKHLHLELLGLLCQQ